MSKYLEAANHLVLFERARAYPRLADLASDRVTLRVPVDDGWSSFNPSLLRLDRRLIGTVRTSNYTFHANDQGRRKAGESPTTVSHLIEFDEELETRSLRPIDDLAVTSDPRGAGGFEDLRLVEFEDRAMVLGTAIDVGASSGTMVVASLDLDRARIVDPKFVESPTGAAFEKNWMPFPSGDRLMAVHTFRPLRLVSLARAGSSRRKPASDPPTSMRGIPLDGRRARGGSAFVPFRSGLLGVVHEKLVQRVTRRLRFPHRFVWLSADLSEARFSRPFFLEAPTVEFVSGLVATDDELLVSWGYRDSEARVWRFAADAVLERVGLIVPAARPRSR